MSQRNLNVTVTSAIIAALMQRLGAKEITLSREEIEDAPLVRVAPDFVKDLYRFKINE